MKSTTRIYLLLVFSFFSLSAWAQSNEATPSPELKLDKLFKLELGLHGAGLSYDLPLSEKWLVDLSTGLGGGYYLDGSGFRSNFILNEPVAFLKSEFRYLYNRSKRLAKAKPISNNAGNYLAFQSKYATRRVFNDNAWDRVYNPLNRSLLNEIHWGIQRSMGQKFLFNFHVGLGYAHDFDFNHSQAYPAAGLIFSYILVNPKR